MRKRTSWRADLARFVSQPLRLPCRAGSPRNRGLPWGGIPEQRHPSPRSGSRHRGSERASLPAEASCRSGLGDALRGVQMRQGGRIYL